MLTDSLPNTLTICGREYIINTDYGTWIRYELLLTEESDKSDEDIFEEILRLIFPMERPSKQYDAETAEKIMWFYRCGKEKEPSSGDNYSGEDIFRYDYDDGYIAAAFKQQYGVCLNKEELHWWEFRAYMLALSEDTEFVKIMGIRAMKIDPKLPASQKEHYRKMKRIYKLPMSDKIMEQKDRLEEALIKGKPIDGLL